MRKPLCSAFVIGEISRETVGDLIRGGAAELLIGQPDNNWLDAKSQEYDLSEPGGMIRLAESVAKFANGEDGGLIVIGAKAKKVPGGEIIAKAEGIVPRQLDTESKYQFVLDSRLYPPIQGLRIESIGMDHGKSIILIDIPPQPQELRPFLVHGVISDDGRVRANYFGIVVRRGESSIATTAPMVHSILVAGRSFLRGDKNNFQHD